MKKKWMTLLTVMLLLVSAMPVSAASNVTKKMRGDRDLKQISAMFSAYTTAMNLRGDLSEEQMCFPLDDANRLSIGAFVRYNYKDDYGYTAKELKQETRNLFGKASRTNVLKKAEKARLLVCEAAGGFVKDPYMYCGGDFSDCIPEYKIKKVTQLKKNVYRLEIRNRMGIYGEKGYEDMGTTILKVKKKKGSAYGYVVKEMSWRK